MSAARKLIDYLTDMIIDDLDGTVESRLVTGDTTQLDDSEPIGGAIHCTLEGKEYLIIVQPTDLPPYVPGRS